MRKQHYLTCLLFLLGWIPSNVYSQTRIVSGKVTNAKGEAIPLATINQKGTSHFVTAAENGHFSINITGTSPILVFSSSGYQKQEITVGAETTYDIQLKESGTLGEVVVSTAFGIRQRKKALGYSVQEIGAARLSEGRENNFISALQGKVNNVNITSTGGAPGSGTDIVIRGISSLSPGANNQPLIIIDGIPVNNSTNVTAVIPSTGTAGNQAASNDQFAFANRGLDINPNDIESISVLKGAGATALYGLQASNGVLIITTKKGLSGKTSINVSSSLSEDFLTKWPEIQTTYREGSNGRVNVNYDGTLGSKFQTFGPVRTAADPLYNNFKRAFGTGQRYDNSISVQGGNGKATYYNSFSALNQDGILAGTGYKRYTFKLSGTYQVSDRLNIVGSASLITSKSNMPSAGDKGVMTALSYHTTTYDVKDYIYPDGSMKVYSPGNIDNPLYTAKYSQMVSNLFRFVGNLGLSYTIVPGLRFDYKIGADMYGDKRTRIVPGPRYPNDPTTLDIAIANGGFIVEERLNFRDVNSNAYLTWDHRLGDNFNLTVLGGNNIQVTQTDLTNTRGEKFALLGFYDIGNTTNLFAFRSTTNRKYAGFFASAKIGFKDALFLELTGRNDWSSTLPSRNNSFFYPAASLSYVFTQLHKMDSRILNFGKLRLSYSQVGKDALPYSNGPYYQSVTGFPFQNVTGASIPGFLRNPTIGDHDLKAEIQKSFEIGTELHFLRDRINVDVSYYNSKNENQIIPVPVSYTGGYSKYITNAGTIRNTGLELELNATPIKMKDFSWNLIVNWAQNKSKVLAINNGITEILFYDEIRINSKLVVGGSAGDLYGQVYQRDPQGRLLINSNPAATSNYGLPQYTANFVKAGNALPDWVGTVNSSFTYKNWTLSGLLEYKKGGDMYDVTMRNSIRNGVLKITENRYQQIVFNGVKMTDGKVNDIPVTLDRNNYYNAPAAFTNVADVLIQDASWLRIRNISLNYRLPAAWISRTRAIRGVSLGLTATNFILWTPYKGYDPGSTAYSSGYNVYGFTGSNIPNFSSVIFNLNINL